MIELSKRETANLDNVLVPKGYSILPLEKAYLGISRICVKYIREELASTGNPSNHQPMDIEAINHKEM
jgi:hypothetical protein